MVIILKFYYLVEFSQYFFEILYPNFILFIINLVLDYEGQDRIKLTEFIQDKFPKNPTLKLQITSAASNSLNKSPQNPTKRGNLLSYFKIFN